MLDPNEAVRILDLCDRVLAQPSQRGHRFAWLLTSAEPAAEPARVDAWYPEARLAVDVRGLHQDDELHRRAAIVHAYDLDYAVVDARDEEGVRAQVGSREALARQAMRWGPESVVGWVEEDEEWDWEPGGPRPPDPDEIDLADLLDEVGPRDSGAAQVLGWRGRSIALALLGALALARRALRLDVDDLLPREHGLDVLLALAAAEPREATHSGLGAAEIARALVLDPVHVDGELRRLQRDGLVVAGGIPEEGPGAVTWGLAPEGLDAVVALLARAAPLFRDWPPD
ncbi:MAG TPA: hypothetical protein VHF89_03025 [Solirubrobacteraceae bacterium]|nr:hypothetical protein [Solirubrobacteraceae bacterium]